MNKFLRITGAALVAGSILTAAGVAAAPRVGPPLICQPFDIGAAPSLPADQPGAVPRDRLVPEALALLTPAAPVIVRMETLRRAVMLAPDNAVRQALLCELQARVLDREARDAPDANAWFDAGYFAASWAELDPGNAPEVGHSDACVGYAWIKKAIALGGVPDMHFGAALAVHPAMHKGTHELHRSHLAKAAAAAEPGSLLERNVKNHCTRWSESYDALRTKGQQPSDPSPAR